jgi:hypothetical protein
MSAKLYRLNLEAFAKMSAEVAKLPKQQQIILKTMSEHCVDTGMKGSDIVDLAKKSYGLETRQKSTVLYAWYARSNEAFGVFHEPAAITVAPTPAAKPDVAKSKTK